MKRQCCQCKTDIFECMGVVKAGDVLEKRSFLRELCGKCALMFQWTKSGSLKRRENTEYNVDKPWQLNESD